MKLVLCYQLDDNSIYLNYEDALKAEQFLLNKTVIDYTQLTTLKFKVNDIVYCICYGFINKCKVEQIENNIYYYDENTDNKITEIHLRNLLDNVLYCISTTVKIRDLNNEIKLTPQEFFNFT